MRPEFDNVLDLLRQKGFYPHEYMSNFENFKEQLLSKQNFYSLLTGTQISGKEYDHVLKVLNSFKMKSMKDNHDFYLKWDVSLFGYVFKDIRNNSIKNYELCQSHYLSSPALIWDAMFNMTKVRLILISDLGMYILFEKGMRGEVSYISNRYSKGSNKCLKSY